jgi:hypothetical protein
MPEITTSRAEHLPVGELSRLSGVHIETIPRTRAKQVLARAKTFRDTAARQKMGRIEMGRIAVSYKKLAQRLEHEAGGAEKNVT